MKKLFATILLAFLTAQVFATFTAFPPQTSGTSTLDIAQAQLWGSVKYAPTSGCTFSTTSSSYGNFATQASCPTQTLSGKAVDLGDKRPAIKFNSLKAGRYVVRVMSTFYTTADSRHCYFRVSDGTNVSNAQSQYFHQQDGGMEFEFEYQTDQGATTFDVQAKVDTSGGVTCQLIGDDFQSSGRGHEISVYYYPSEQKVFQSSCSGLECVQSFSAKISDTGAVTDENVDWISGNCSTDAGTGQFDCTLAESTMDLNCTIGAQESSAANVTLGTQLTNAGAGTLRYRTLNSSSTSAGLRNTVVNCQRSGSSYKQFDSRFIPVSDNEAQSAYYHTRGDADGRASTNTAIAYFANEVYNDISECGTVENSATNGWSFTASKPCKVSVSFGATQTTSFWIGLSKNSTQLTTSLEAINDDDIVAANVVLNNGYPTIVSWSGVLNKDDVIRTHVHTSATIDSDSKQAFVSISTRAANQKAFIGNLTPKEFVQTPGSTKPVTYSAQVSSADAVSNEIGSWINGNCTNATTGRATCTFESNTFSSSPNCQATGVLGNTLATIESVSSSSVVIRTQAANTTSDTDLPFYLACHGVQ